MIPRPPHKIELVVVGAPKDDPVKRFLNPPREAPICITACDTTDLPVKIDIEKPKNHVPFYRRFQNRRRNR
jgi:hypothetical protein